MPASPTLEEWFSSVLESQTPSFGQRLRGARKAAGLTQAEAAKKSGKSQVYWSSIESEHVRPHKKYMKYRKIMEEYMKTGGRPTRGEIRRFQEAKARLEPLATAVSLAVEDLFPREETLNPGEKK
jgi:transcriptional regulator with XRE-family HTH domain